MNTIHGELITTNHKYAGIYAIINLKNNKFYIGSSVNIYNRKARHFWELDKGVHDNKHLQNAYNLDKKYFIMVLVEKVEGSDKYLREIEQKWLDELQPYKKEIGYNLCSSAFGTSGYKFSEETKQSLPSNKLVYQYSLEGKLIKTWKSGAQASRKLGYKRENIYRACNEEITHYKKYIWSYKELSSDILNLKIKLAYQDECIEGIPHKQSQKTREKISQTLKGHSVSDETRKKIGEKHKDKVISEEHKQKIREFHSIPIIQLDLEGNYIREWDSAREASRELGFTESCIGACCKGQRKTHKSFKWIYKTP